MTDPTKTRVGETVTVLYEDLAPLQPGGGGGGGPPGGKPDPNRPKPKKKPAPPPPPKGDNGGKGEGEDEAQPYVVGEEVVVHDTGNPGIVTWAGPFDPKHPGRQEIEVEEV